MLVHLLVLYLLRLLHFVHHLRFESFELREAFPDLASFEQAVDISLHEVKVGRILDTYLLQALEHQRLRALQLFQEEVLLYPELSSLFWLRLVRKEVVQQLERCSTI